MCTLENLVVKVDYNFDVTAKTVYIFYLYTYKYRDRPKYIVTMTARLVMYCFISVSRLWSQTDQVERT